MFQEKTVHKKSNLDPALMSAQTALCGLTFETMESRALSTSSRMNALLSPPLGTRILQI